MFDTKKSAILQFLTDSEREKYSYLIIPCFSMCIPKTFKLCSKIPETDIVSKEKNYNNKNKDQNPVNDY